MMLDRLHSQPLTPPPPPPPPPPKPEKAEEQEHKGEKTATVAKDESNVSGGNQTSTAKLPGEKKKDDFNPLDAKDSTGRTVADITSNVNTGAEVAKDTRGIASVAASAGTRVGWLSRIGSSVSTGLSKVADWGDDIARAAPKVGRAFTTFAKAAPFVGVAMAGLDIGKAALEKDPEKKREAKGTAALSTLSAGAGIAGAALLVPPATAVGAALIGVGIAASVFSFVDTTFFKGAASKKIGDAVDWVADKGKKVGEAVGDAAKAVGNGVKNAAKAVGNFFSGL
jgi:hypothetical protein